MSNLLKNLVLLAVSSVVVVTAAELTARVAFPEWAPRTGRLADLWQFDPDYGWSHVPGAKGRFRSHAFNTQVEINSDGFRGPDIAPKDSLRTRIIVLGDSYVFGYGVEHEEAFSSRLEARCPALEVVNLGVSGYSTDQEFLLFKERGVAYEPDIVILVIVDNDYEANGRSRAYVYYQKPAFVIENDRLVLTNRPASPPRLLVKLTAGIGRHSYLLNQVNRTIAGLRRARTRGAAALPSAPSDSMAPGRSRTFPRSTAEAVTTMILSNFMTAVEAAGARMVVLLAEEQGVRGAAVAEFFQDRPVPFVQMDEYMDSTDYARYRLVGDPHWNAAGHDLVARVILRKLLESGMIEGSSCSSYSAGANH